jgi:uncharacterized protein YfaS (alpha-2-macroglobulin family)
MKRLSLSFLSAICLVVLFAACNRNGKLSIKEVNFPNGEVQIQQSLVFTLSADVVTDSLLYKADSTHYLNFSPSVQGVYEWTGRNQLTFSPFQSFLPSTEYKVTLTKKILNHSKKSLPIDDKAITFHTPYLKLANVETFWTLKNGNASSGVYVGVNLDFNYTVSPSSILQKLKLTQDKTLVQPELVSADDGMQVKLLFKPVDGEKYPCALSIDIDKGVRCVGSNKETEQAINYLSQIPPKDQFQVESALPVFQNGQSYINVTTTQPVVAENIDQYISFKPEVKFKVTTTGNGFNITGDFSNKIDYTLTISGKLRNIFGIELKDDYNGSIHFGTPPPYIAFSDKNSIYLSSQGNRNIGVQIISVPKVRLTVYKVYENNILHYLRRGQQYQSYGSYNYNNEGDDGEDDGYHYTDDYTADTTFGDVITRRDVSTTSLPMTGMTSLLDITPADIQADNTHKGIYMVQVQDKKKPWIQDSKLLVVSDIGMIVKKGQNNIYVFCHSILTGNKLSGTKITFVSDNNQEIYSATTDGDGMATFEYDRSKYPGKDVVAIIASSGTDFSFMNLPDNTINMSPFDIGGKTTTNVPYDAYMYGCRDLYRPGDTININSIVRTFDWKTLKDVPVKFKITMPNGKQLQELKGKLDEEGSCAISFNVPSAAMTGAYNITMYSGNDVLLKSQSFMVEEFMPQRIKVTVQSDAAQYDIGQTAKIFVQANELFGPPAANKNYQSTFDLNFTPFYSKNFSDYTFYITRPNSITFEQQTADGKTDDRGAATIEYTISDQSNVGLLTGKSIVTVFDETGRPVNREADFKVYTQKVFYGIKNFDTWVGTDKPLNVNFAAVDKNGNAFSGSNTAYVQVIKHTWETVLTNSYNSYRYQSQEVNHTVFYKETLFQNGSAGISFTPSESGEYEIRIMPYSGCSTYVSSYFYAYGSGNTQYNSFQVQKEGNIQIVAKQASYKPGEEASLLFKCPFDGELIVTVEQNEMLEKYFVHTDNKAASLSIPIRKDDLPGVYVSASLIRPLSDNSIPLTIARGFIPLKVEDLANKLNVQINAVETTHSKTSQTIKVKTAPNAEVTIAAVDEGTLQITNFQTPDPYNYFYSKRALEVNTFDIYPRVLPELSALGISSFGGDEGLEGRLNPVGGKRVRILSYWSGTLKANGSGECSYTINIPEFSGSLRLMAVAYKGSSFGSSEKNMIVADPIVISSSLPRFLSPNDQNTLSVSLNNTTNSKMTAKTSLGVSGPLQVSGSATQDIDIPAHSERDVTFQLNAGASIGVGQVDIAVKANGANYTEHEEISVRPPMPLTKLTEGGEVTGGQVKDINLTTSFAGSDASKGYILISKSPLAVFNKNLGNLLNYPYGCMEQTVSTAFPVLYYSALVKALGQKDNNQRLNPNFIITEAIKKIYSAQLYNGGLAYWPGIDGSGESWWCSAYALHFLVEAKKSGYEVDGTVMDNLVQFLQNQVNGTKNIAYFYYDAQSVLRQREVVPEEVFYSLYVLAISGHPNIPTMNYYKSSPGLMTLDSRYMLAAAYALSGDTKAFSSMLPNGFEGERATRCLSGSFYSYLRDESISLATLVDAQPDNPQIPILARHISEELKKDVWYSTQENAFALIALGKLSQNAIKSSATASLWINGAKAGDISADQLTYVAKQDITNKKVEIKTAGTGYVYYYYETQGIPTGNTFKEDDSYLKVRKSFYDNNGNQLTDMNNFKENQLVVVKVHIESLDNRYVDNVAITDIIPACFEIENPRINPERELQWIKDKATPDFMDIRDDRITFFVNVTPKGQDFYYLARAVSTGKYVMGPVGADAMYDDSYHSYSGSGSVTVK